MTSQVSRKYETETRQSLLIGTNWKVFPSKKSGTVPLVTIAVAAMPKKDARGAERAAVAPSLAGPELPFDVQDGGRVDALDLGQRDVGLLLVVVVQVEPPRPVTGPTAAPGIALCQKHGKEQGKLSRAPASGDPARSEGRAEAATCSVPALRDERREGMKGASPAHRRGPSAPLEPPQPGHGTAPPRGPAAPGWGCGSPGAGPGGDGARCAAVSASDGAGARPGAVPGRDGDGSSPWNGAGRGWRRGLAPERGRAHLLGRAQVVGAAGQDAVPALHRAPLHRVRAELRVHHLQRARPARRGHGGRALLRRRGGSREAPGRRGRPVCFPVRAGPGRSCPQGAASSPGRAGRARGAPLACSSSHSMCPCRGKGLRLQRPPGEGSLP